MKKLKKIKISWLFFGILVLVYAIVGLINYDGVWTNSFLQVGAIFLTIIFTLILSIENNKQLSEQTRNQIDFITQNTDRQIDEIRKSTEMQVNTLHNTTDKQIENYREETEKLVKQLKNNSELLAGILQRQLEDAMEETHKDLDNARSRFTDLNGFKLLRTNQEKEVQLNQQKNFINRIESKIGYFKRQYEKLSIFVRGIA